MTYQVVRLETVDLPRLELSTHEDHEEAQEVLEKLTKVTGQSFVIVEK